MQDLADLLTDLRKRAADAAKPQPERVMYFLPDLPVDDLAEHVELAKQVRDLGVDWLVVNGQGRTRQQATDWIGRYRDAIMAVLG